MLSPLQLSAVRLERLVLRAAAPSPAPSETEDYRVTLSHRELPLTSTSGAKRLQLRVRLMPDKKESSARSFDEIDIIVSGRFSFAEDATDKHRKMLFPLAAVSVLFGFARGIVAQTTGLFPTGTFLLPPVNVVAAAKRKRLVGQCTLVPAAGRSEQSTLQIQDELAPEAVLAAAED